jgi:hypothetical protein
MAQYENREGKNQTNIHYKFKDMSTHKNNTELNSACIPPAQHSTLRTHFHWCTILRKEGQINKYFFATKK